MKNKTLYPFLSVLIFTIVQVITFSSAEAHTAETVWSGSCTTPSSNTAYDGAPGYGSSSKYGITYYHQTNHSNDYWVNGSYTGEEPNIVHTPGYTNHSGDYTDHLSTGAVGGCGASASTSGTKYGGTIIHSVTYSSTGVSSASQKHTEYHVIAVDVTVSNDYTYVDQSPATFACVATYPDNHTKNCTNSLTLKSDVTTNGIRKICYTYTDNQRTDHACATRVYVKSVEITQGPDHTYTGMHHYFYCQATFSDGVPKNVSTSQNVWSSTPYNYIGSSYEGYIDPRGQVHRQQAYNDFYPADPKGKNYIIQCEYYPTKSTNFSNRWITDPPNRKTTTKTITLHGIEKYEIKANGYFLTLPNQYQYSSNIRPNATTFYYDNYDFMKGHWYDFRAYIQYDDGSQGGGNPGAAGWREITNAPEVYWSTDPGYTDMQTYNTKMSYSGLDHRIPQNGKNYILSEYFDPESSGIYGSTPKPNEIIQSFSHQENTRTYTAPSTGTYLLQVWGAQGGGGSGGRGGYSAGEIELKKGELLYVTVGGSNGYNGGGMSYYAESYGGGGTDIRKGNTSLNSRIIVAGGGGGNGPGGGGYGGGSVGGTGVDRYGSPGYGGSQTAGGSGYQRGSFGQGGNAQLNISAGAGGGGWYGGGGASTDYPGFRDHDDSGGGGGSGYIGGVKNGTMVAGNTAMPSPNGTTQTGHGGHGYAIITFLSNEKIPNIPGSRFGANGKTKQEAIAWGHEIVDLKIKGVGASSSPPQTSVRANETVNYTAWITWSDEGTNPFGHGQKENWTSGVVWKGDNVIGSGRYQFPRGNGEKRTVYAYYADYDNLRSSINVWDHAFDKLEITINDDCSNIDYLRWGCNVPTNIWQTSGYQTDQTNFLPPAHLYGFGSWNRNTDPYRFYVEFPVTGLSTGNSFQ